MATMIIDLPNHILVEILLRLPIKALLASRCVCRLWLYLISDPHFSKLRMTRAPNELFLRPRYNEVDSTTLYMPDLQGDLGKLNLVFDLPRLFSVRILDLYMNFDAISSRLFMVNCCNGFICYHGPCTNRFAAVWNPITGELVISPAPRKETEWRVRVSHGFGFSPKTNEYKLLRMVHGYDLDCNPIADMAYVLTVQEGGFWRTVQDKPYWLPYPLCPTFLGNSLHWLCNDDSCSETIASFDFDIEQFGEVLPPPNLVKGKITSNEAKPNSVYDLRLGMLEDCLCISADNRSSATDVWVMKEYGDPDSWTKAFSIERYYPLGQKENYEVMQCLDSGEIVISLNSTHLFLYDRIKGTKVLLGSCDGRLERVVYRPTFCWLKDITLEEDAKYEHHAKPRRPMYSVGRRVTENPPWWTKGRNTKAN